MEKLSKEYIKQIGQVWDCKNVSSARSAWWNSEKIIRHMNYLICGEEFNGWNAGVIKELIKFRNHFKKAVSIGCGVGSKEMKLLELGVVDEFCALSFLKKGYVLDSIWQRKRESRNG